MGSPMAARRCPTYRGKSKEFRDRPEKPLEQRLNDVFMAGYCQIVRDRVDDRKHKARNDEYEAKLKQQRLAKQLIELSRRLDAYSAKQKADAVAEAERWRQSQLLRDYVAAVRCQASQSRDAVSASVASWITWATEVADEIDPLPIRLESPADQQRNRCL